MKRLEREGSKGMVGGELKNRKLGGMGYEMGGRIASRIHLCYLLQPLLYQNGLCKTEFVMICRFVMSLLQRMLKD